LERRDGVFEDNLFILLRGLRGDFLAPGRSREVPFLPSPFVSRLRHRPIDWQTARIERLTRPETVTVPAGRFDTSVYVVRVGDRAGRFCVETAYPHRIVRWTWEATAAAGVKGPAPDGTETGELTGSERLQYWKLHGNGDESWRGRLGLPDVDVP